MSRDEQLREGTEITDADFVPRCDVCREPLRIANTAPLSYWPCPQHDDHGQLAPEPTNRAGNRAGGCPKCRSRDVFHDRETHEHPGTFTCRACDHVFDA